MYFAAEARGVVMREALAGTGCEATRARARCLERYSIGAAGQVPGRVVAEAAA